MECIVSVDYETLQKEGTLTQVLESDIKRVLIEYKLNEMPIIPSDDYFEKSADIYQYTDGSGYHVDIDFWYVLNGCGWGFSPKMKCLDQIIQADRLMITFSLRYLCKILVLLYL